MAFLDFLNMQRNSNSMSLLEITVASPAMAKWLAGVMNQINRPNAGTLPDFGNFHDYDRYKGVEELMPYAKGVSAKSHDFDANGDETKTDYRRMLKLVLDAGYHGYVGVEYEGKTIPGSRRHQSNKIPSRKVRDEMSTS